MRRSVQLLAFLAFVLLSAQSEVLAACWRLPSGSIVETQSNSTPPMRGAQRVPCPTPNIGPIEQTGVRELSRRRDDRQCVAYVRSRVILPSRDLSDWSVKRDLINRDTPRAGYVAIINEAQPYGHLAYVEDVTSNSITISETNYVSGYYTRRRSVGRDLADAQRRLRIVGYRAP
jgi:hypothetical protein